MWRVSGGMFGLVFQLSSFLERAVSKALLPLLVCCLADGWLWGHCEADWSFLWRNSEPYSQYKLYEVTPSTFASNGFLAIIVKKQKTLLFSLSFQSMLKDDEFFKEISNSPNPSVTDEESNAWGCLGHDTWSCCEWNSVPTLILAHWLLSQNTPR